MPPSFDWDGEALLRLRRRAAPPAGTWLPCRIQAWREVNELPDRELMLDGRWLV